MPDIQFQVYGINLLVRLNAANRATEANTCPNGRKYEPNPWLNNMVDQLRTYSTRFGYNAKPTRTAVDNNGFPVIAAGDEIAFFHGSGNAQGSPQVYAIDILFGHCGGSPELTYRDIAPEPAIWTGAGRLLGSAVGRAAPGGPLRGRTGSAGGTARLRSRGDRRFASGGNGRRDPTGEAGPTRAQRGSPPRSGPPA